MPTPSRPFGTVFCREVTTLADEKKFTFRWNKKWGKPLLAAAIVLAVVGAVWGGLTIAGNAQRSDVKVYPVEYFSMTDYWGDSGNTSGRVTTDKLQKVYTSSTQTVSRIYVAEGDEVRKGDKLLSYDSTLTQAQVQRAEIAYDRQVENLSVAKDELELLQKAKNKELLELELKALQDELKKKQDAYDAQHRYDPTAAVTEGKLSATGSYPILDSTGRETGSEKVYYYSFLTTSSLNDAAVQRVLTGLAVPRADKNTEQLRSVTTNVVLVQRYKDEIGGYITDQWGLRISETYGVDDDTAVLSYKLVSDLPAYEDEGHTYNDKDIEKLQRKIDMAQELLDASMTYVELQEAIAAKQKEVKSLDTDLKVAKLELDKQRSELGDGNVYAEFAGTVKVLRDVDEAYNTGEAVLELSGGGGYYITGTLSETDLGNVKIGDTVQIDSWMTGASCEGTIVSIEDYPATDSYNNWGGGNSNVSYYPFKVFVDEEQDLQPDTYVDIQYQKVSSSDGSSAMYLETFFLRSESGKSYVMVQGEDGKLEKRWVQTGRDLWGSYTQIRGGLTLEDYVAFPYGRDVVEGANTVQAEPNELYESA